MELMEFLSRNIFVPFYQYKHGVQAGPTRKFLMQSQYYSQDELNNYQTKKIKQIIEYANNHCPYYQNLFKEIGLNPENFRDISDLKSIPILTKDDIRNNLDSMISNEFKKENLHWRRTGGSTGVPLQLYWDDGANSFKSALAYRHNSWAGYLPGMRGAALWGDTNKKMSFKERLYDTLYTRYIWLDTLLMDDSKLFEFADNIRRLKPKMLFGHAHSIYFFTQFLNDNKISDLSFESIISTAEILYPSERKAIEECFGNVIYNRYGCEEVSVVASECESHEGLHIAAEGLYVEVLNGDNTNPGDIILTDLTNRGTPLIRYKVGDLATVINEQCSCGRTLPRLGEIVGRTTDILYTPEKKSISGISILDTFTIHIPSFKQVQIVQNKYDEIKFNIVKSSKFDKSSLELLNSMVAKVFGPAMKYDVNFVQQIPMNQRGKFQFSICNITNDELNKKQ